MNAWNNFTKTRTDWINTHSGNRFFPLEEDPGPILIADIARGLSNMCRYNGQCRFYSVAEHSVRLAAYADTNYGRTLARRALLHDASEAYIADIPRPLKKLPEFAPYLAAEARLQGTIYRAFGLDPHDPVELKEIDTRIIGDEALEVFARRSPRWVLPDPLKVRAEVWGWLPTNAERIFLLAFADLFPEIGQ